MNKTVKKLDEASDAITKWNLEELKQWIDENPRIYKEHKALIFLIAINKACPSIIEWLLDKEPSLVKYNFGEFPNFIEDIDDPTNGKLYNSNSYFSVTPHPISAAFIAKSQKIAEFLRLKGFPLCVESPVWDVKWRHAIKDAVRFCESSNRVINNLDDYVDEKLSKDYLTWLLSGPVLAVSIDICDQILLPICRELNIKSCDLSHLFVQRIKETEGLKTIAFLSKELIKYLPDSFFKLENISDINALLLDHTTSFPTPSIKTNIQRLYLGLFFERSPIDNKTLGDLRLDCFQEALSRGDPDIYANNEFLDATIRSGNEGAIHCVMNNLNEDKILKITEIVSDKDKKFNPKSVNIVKSWLLNHQISECLEISVPVKTKKLNSI